jgi:hypothetical protein
MAPIPPVSHIPLRQLAVLASRLAALPVVKDRDGNPVESGLVRTFSGTVANVNYTDVVSKSLSAYLVGRVGDVATYVGILAAPERRIGNGFVSSLAIEVAKFTCASCSAIGGHRCAGASPQLDSDQIASVGLCLQLIRDLHAHVAAQFWPVVRDWGWHDNGSAVPAFQDRWCSRWNSAAAARPGLNSKVHGKTEFLDQVAGAPYAEVALIFEVDHLDWPSMLQILWVFTHEYICHAWQAPIASGAARTESEPASTFYEGWMDEVARRLLQADLVNRDFAPPTSAFISSERSTLDQAASDYRSARYGWTPGANPCAQAAQWKIGVNAARRASRVFELSVPSSHQDQQRLALRQLVALSWRLQIAAKSEDELEQAVYACLDACDRVLTQIPIDTGPVFAILSGAVTNIARWIKELSVV